MWEIVKGIYKFITRLPKRTISLVAISCFTHYYQFTKFSLLVEDFNNSSNVNISEPRLASIMFIIATTILGCDYGWFKVMPETSLCALPIHTIYYIWMQTLLTQMTELYLWGPFYIGVYQLQRLLVELMVEFGPTDFIDVPYCLSESVHNYFLLASTSYYLVHMLKQNEPFRFILCSLKKALIWLTTGEVEEEREGEEAFH